MTRKPKTHAHVYDYYTEQWATLCSRTNGPLARSGAPTCKSCRRILAAAKRKEK